MNAEDIHSLILAKIPQALVSLIDTKGDGQYFVVRVLSHEFQKKNRIQQHQMVYQALEGKIGSDIHAISLETGVPSHEHTRETSTQETNAQETNIQGNNNGT